MHVLLGCLVAMAMAMAPSGDPRAIDPAANRPEIVAPGGAPAEAKPPTTRPPKRTTPPKTSAAGQPKTPPTTTSSEPTRPVEPQTPPEVEPGRGKRGKAAAATDADQPPQGCLPERGRCWQLNVGGIVAASVGVAMLGTGIGFMQAPQFPDRKSVV